MNTPEMDLWEWIVEHDIATDDEVSLVTQCFGLSVENLNRIIYCRTGYHDKEQCQNCEPELYGSASDDEEEEEDDDNDDGRPMSDEDIAKQYEDFEITAISLDRNRYSKGWQGTLEVNFPNADGIDFDQAKIDNFFVYDELGNHIAFTHWYPDDIADHIKKIIRKEIRETKKI